MPAVALKYLALLSMLADHIYKTFGIRSGFLVIFGRLAFPLFCFLIAQGFHKTRSRPAYLARLLACAIISEIPFDILWRYSFFDLSVQNVCFTLFLGGLSCTLYDAVSKRGGRFFTVVAFFAAAAPIALADFLHTDYGWYGAALVFLLFLTHGSRSGTAAAVILFDAAKCASRHMGASFDFNGFLNDAQHFGLLSLPFILTASGKKGERNKKSFAGRYYFYIFYPLHMALLALLRWILQGGYFL